MPTNPGLPLFTIEDPKLRAILKLISDKLDAVQGATSGTAWRGAPDAANNQLKNLADGTAAQDAVTLAQLQAATNLNTIRDALQASGSTPINITNLVGSGTISTGTHAQRLTTAATPGNWFFETDRTALYFASQSNQWVLGAGNQGGSFAARYSDLTLSDEGYIWFNQDLATLFRWTGAAWRWETGVLVGTFANRPSAASLAASTYSGNVAGTSGNLFAASDYGYQLWVYDRATPKWTVIMGGEPARDTYANMATVAGNLGANDIGFKFYATDIQEEFRWDGAAFQRYLTTPPWACNVYNNADQVIADATDTLLTFNSETADVGGLHSTAANTSRITIPTGGGGTPSIWSFIGQCRWDISAAGTSRKLRILKNGTVVARTTSPPLTGTQVNQQISFLDINPADGDYYELQVNQDSGGNLNATGGSAFTFWIGHKVV